jgi:hypothetical protein
LPSAPWQLRQATAAPEMDARPIPTNARNGSPEGASAST